ncbi:hypothetical protein MSC49_02680 [Methylosinus sp. C49]|uniref:hypothetical protein n=1 Tax=Methylosinus sp. C49 TaxID=2699395 RepID=UPI0013678CED|nr:hypothetical protein [Methylosinus sp. C49]BBU60333.1 hypothetical protein MSC49_02680 [Methylosinus sp. C49]
MQVIVPLAGPDFEQSDGRVKSEFEVHGTPLLRLAIESRAWWRSGQVTDSDLIFVLRDSFVSRRFASDKLAQWYPNARQVFLSDYTRGAALTVLAGVALVGHAEEILCFDLADILFEERTSALSPFTDMSVGAVGLTFPSNHPAYSYLRRDAAGNVVEAAEKRVISEEASAGVYLFRSPVIYLRALAYVLDHRAEHVHRDLFFVCPVLNGVLAQGLKVNGLTVCDITDIKLS